MFSFFKIFFLFQRSKVCCFVLETKANPDSLRHTHSPLETRVQDERVLQNKSSVFLKEIGVEKCMYGWQKIYNIYRYISIKIDIYTYIQESPHTLPRTWNVKVESCLHLFQVHFRSVRM